MKIIHRYMLKELLLNFFLILVFLNIILFMHKFLQLTRTVLIKGADVLDIFWIFIYLQSSLMLLTIPMAFIISVFLVFGRMMTDNEMITIRASGMSFWNISKPLFLIAIFSFIISVFLSLYVAPSGLRAFKTFFYKVIAGKAALSFETGTFSKTFRDTVIFINKKVSEEKLKGIFIYRELKDKQSFVTVAKEAIFDPKPDERLILLRLHDAIFHSTGSDDSSTSGNFKKYTLALTSEAEGDEKSKLDEAPMTELWNKRDDQAYSTELHKRFSLPFVCIIFGLLAPPLALLTGKTGKIGGIFISFFIWILYYLLFSIGGGISSAGKISPILGVWGPDFLFGILGIWLSLKAQFEGQLRIRK